MDNGAMNMLIGLFMLLLFFYLKRKGVKEDSGFLYYIGMLIVLAILLVGGIMFIIDAFPDAPPKL